MSEIQRTPSLTADDERSDVVLRPIERCVLNSLGAGSGYAQVAARLRRTPSYVYRVEQLANLRLDLAS